MLVQLLANKQTNNRTNKMTYYKLYNIVFDTKGLKDARKIKQALKEDHDGMIMHYDADVDGMDDDDINAEIAYDLGNITGFAVKSFRRATMTRVDPA